jgi:HEAT repeat protein
MRRRDLVPAAILCWLTCALGCSSSPLADNFRAPWRKPPQQAPGITTAAQQVAELKEMRKRAAQGTPEEHQRLCAQLAEQIKTEEDSQIRIEILKTLAVLNTPLSAAVLQAALQDSDPDVRVTACESWGKRPGEEASGQLARVLASDTSLDVRLAAARALGQTASKGAIAPLGEALSDNDPALQYRAMQSLKSLSGRDYGNDVNAWRQYAKSGEADVHSPSIAQRLKSWF